MRADVEKYIAWGSMCFAIIAMVIHMMMKYTGSQVSDSSIGAVVALDDEGNGFDGPVKSLYSVALIPTIPTDYIIPFLHAVFNCMLTCTDPCRMPPLIHVNNIKREKIVISDIHSSIKFFISQSPWLFSILSKLETFFNVNNRNSGRDYLWEAAQSIRAVYGVANHSEAVVVVGSSLFKACISKVWKAMQEGQCGLDAPVLNDPGHDMYSIIIDGNCYNCFGVMNGQVVRNGEVSGGECCWRRA